MWDEDVIEVVQFAPPTIMDKKFFKKMSYFVGWMCNNEVNGTVQHPKWLCDWDWCSFQRNILEPNRKHIQRIISLSDALTDQIVDSADDWAGEASPDLDDGCILSHINLFTVESLDFQSEIFD